MNIMRSREIASRILIGILSVLFIFASFAKIFGAKQITEMFVQWGLADWQIMIGFGLLISTVLFLVPATFSLGILFLSSYWGGAIVTHIINESSFLVPAVILILVWVTAYIRNPKMFYTGRLKK